MNDEQTQNGSVVEDELDINPYVNKERRLVTQPYDMSVTTVVSQIDSGDIILEPEYQRKYRWSNIKASRFIESLLLNIPIPTIFLAEEEDVTYSVIDGQQRLTTLKNFMNGEGEDDIVLEGLQVRSDLNGLKYSDLSKEDAGRLRKQYIRCIVILNDSDPQIKFDVFERLNSGSVQQTEQEIRNCIYRGSLNASIKKMSTNEKFLKMLNLPEKDSKNMTSNEYVLRFLSYRESLADYQGSVKEFLNDFMNKNKNLADEKVEEYSSLFTETVNNIYEVLGDNGFSRFIPDKGWHVALNRAVFDAEMVAFSRYTLNLDDKEVLLRDIIELMLNQDFIRDSC